MYITGIWWGATLFYVLRSTILANIAVSWGCKPLDNRAAHLENNIILNFIVGTTYIGTEKVCPKFNYFWDSFENKNNLSMMID